MKGKMIAALVAVAVLFMGCGAKNTETDVYVPAESSPEENTDTEDVLFQEAESMTLTESEDAGEKMTVQLTELSGMAVVILAHIKETDNNSILISSDSDGFPGVFRVEVPENVYTTSELKGGTCVLILMQSKEEETSGIPEYIAWNLTVLEEQTHNASADVDLAPMAPPVITLADPLSSTYNLFEVSSGNYSWNVEMDDGKMTGGIACGMHPLDEAEHAKLKLPQYQKMDTVVYMVGIAIAPDRLIVRKWDAADMGNTDAEELSVVTFYEPILLLNLEAGRVYELTAIWEEKKADARRFFGEASYIFVTE